MMKIKQEKGEVAHSLSKEEQEEFSSPVLELCQFRKDILCDTFLQKSE